MSRSNDGKLGSGLRDWSITALFMALPLAWVGSHAGSEPLYADASGAPWHGLHASLHAGQPQGVAAASAAAAADDPLAATVIEPRLDEYGALLARHAATPPAGAAGDSGVKPYWLAVTQPR